MKYTVKISTQASKDIKEIYEYIAEVLYEKEKTVNVAELNSLLDMNHTDDEIVDGEIGNNEPEKEKDRDLER